MNMLNFSCKMAICFLSILSAALCFPQPAVFAQGTNGASSANSLEAFSIISQRNIFDPGRHAKSGQGYKKRRINPDIIARAEGFSLVGTMIHENGAFAFFDGTDVSYRKVFQATNTIADFTIREIAPNYVQLDGKGGSITLPVGMQMKKLGPNDWQVISMPTLSNSLPVATNAAPALQNKPGSEPGLEHTAETPTGAVSRMLLQPREQEIKK